MYKSYALTFLLSFVLTIATSQITKYPLMEFSSAENLVITQIETITDKIGNTFTSIQFELSPIRDEYFMIPHGMYINDANDARKRYELLESSQGEFILNKWHPVKAGRLYNYTLVFEGVEQCTASINVYEPKLIGVDVAPWIWQKIKLNSMCDDTSSTASTYQFEEEKPKIKKKKIIIGY